MATLSVPPDWIPVATIAGFQSHAIEKKSKSKSKPFKDKVQNLGNERRYIYKDPRQDSGPRNISYTRYPKKCFTEFCYKSVNLFFEKLINFKVIRFSNTRTV